MEDIFLLILQFLLEFFLEVILNWPIWYAPTFEARERENTFLQSFLLFTLGVIAAGFSLLIVKHSLIPVQGLRIANMVLAPIVSGIISRHLALRRKEANPDVYIRPSRHFWWAFSFTLAFVTTRYLCLLRA